MSKRALAVTLALVLTTTAGCTDLFGDDLPSDALVRSIVIDLDVEKLERLEQTSTPVEIMAEMADTFFVYTHQGDAVATADLSASFVDETGTEVTHPLSDFSNQAELAEGDQVTIEGAILYSPMLIQAGGEPLAKRGLDVDWLMAEGVPLPVAADRGSDAQWSFGSNVEMTTSLDEFSYSEDRTYQEYNCADPAEPETCEWTDTTTTETLLVRDAEWSMGSSLDGTVDLGRSSDALDAVYDLEGVVTMFADAFFSMTTTDEDGSSTEEGNVGMDGEFRALADALGRMRLDGDVGTHAGGEMSFSTDGHLFFWDQDTPRDEAVDLMEGEQWPAESIPYEEEALNPAEPDEDAELIRALYNMDIVAGDTFRFVFFVDEPDEDTRFQMSIDIDVAARETIEVAAGKVPALRIVSNVAMDAEIPGVGPQRMAFDGIKHWIHADTYIPVLMDYDAGDLIDEEELSETLRSLGGLADDYDLDITLPETLELGFEGGSSIELTSLDGSVRMPALFWAAGYMGAGILPSALVFLLVSDVSGSEWEYTPAEFPQVQANDAVDAVTASPDDGLIELLHAGGETVSPWDFEFLINGESTWAMSADCTTEAYSWSPGESICLAENGYTDIMAEPGNAQLVVVDWTTGMIVFETTVAVS